MAHHGSVPSDKVKQFLKMQEKLESKLRERRVEPLGKTSRYPEGKILPEDEGEIRIGFGVKDGKVIIDFGGPVAWIGMTPQQALKMAQSLMDCAKECSDDVLTIKL